MTAGDQAKAVSEGSTMSCCSATPALREQSSYSDTNSFDASAGLLGNSLPPLSAEQDVSNMLYQQNNESFAQAGQNNSMLNNVANAVHQQFAGNNNFCNNTINNLVNVNHTTMNPNIFSNAGSLMNMKNKGTAGTTTATATAFSGNNYSNHMVNPGNNNVDTIQQQIIGNALMGINLNANFQNIGGQEYQQGSCAQAAGVNNCTGVGNTMINTMNNTAAAGGTTNISSEKGNHGNKPVVHVMNTCINVMANNNISNATNHCVVNNATRNIATSTNDNYNNIFMNGGITNNIINNYSGGGAGTDEVNTNTLPPNNNIVSQYVNLGGAASLLLSNPLLGTAANTTDNTTSAAACATAATGTNNLNNGTTIVMNNMNMINNNGSLVNNNYTSTSIVENINTNTNNVLLAAINNINYNLLSNCLPSSPPLAPGALGALPAAYVPITPEEQQTDGIGKKQHVPNIVNAVRSGSEDTTVDTMATAVNASARTSHSSRCSWDSSINSSPCGGAQSTNLNTISVCNTLNNLMLNTITNMNNQHLLAGATTGTKMNGMLGNSAGSVTGAVNINNNLMNTPPPATSMLPTTTSLNGLASSIQQQNSLFPPTSVRSVLYGSCGSEDVGTKTTGMQQEQQQKQPQQQMGAYNTTASNINVHLSATPGGPVQQNTSPNHATRNANILLIANHIDNNSCLQQQLLGLGAGAGIDSNYRSMLLLNNGAGGGDTSLLMNMAGLTSPQAQQQCDLGAVNMNNNNLGTAFGNQYNTNNCSLSGDQYATNNNVQSQGLTQTADNNSSWMVGNNSSNIVDSSDRDLLSLQPTTPATSFAGSTTPENGKTPHRNRADINAELAALSPALMTRLTPAFTDMTASIAYNDQRDAVALPNEDGSFRNMQHQGKFWHLDDEIMEQANLTTGTPTNEENYSLQQVHSAFAEYRVAIRSRLNETRKSRGYELFTRWEEWQPSGEWYEKWAAPIPELKLPTDTDTIIIRNISNRYWRDELMIDLIESIGLDRKCIAMLYAPVDINSSQSLGYCHICFREPEDALFAAQFIHGGQFNRHWTKKVLTVERSRCQGWRANLMNLYVARDKYQYIDACPVAFEEEKGRAVLLMRRKIDEVFQREGFSDAEVRKHALMRRNSRQENNWKQQGKNNWGDYGQKFNYNNYNGHGDGNGHGHVPNYNGHGHRHGNNINHHGNQNRSRNLNNEPSTSGYGSKRNNQSHSADYWNQQNNYENNGERCWPYYENYVDSYDFYQGEGQGYNNEVGCKYNSNNVLHADHNQSGYQYTNDQQTQLVEVTSAEPADHQQQVCSPQGGKNGEDYCEERCFYDHFNGQHETE
ncbi:unnamed protein product [Amoebophrya sp. A25]|nr:unnamed protein product [Amoebophrya sp. A25]|eukprot:GSA25T00023461001.1